MDWLTVDIQALLATALTIGVVHTLLGPDHYLPFIAIGRERRWTPTHTLAVTACCGIGHCVGSVALGLLGISAGVALGSLEMLESARGTVAAWLFIGFGIAYACWSVRRHRRKRRHEHLHAHADGTVHTHTHSHKHEHAHTHSNKSTGPLLLSLMIVFLLGPCESLIPLLMYPAAQSNYLGLALVTLTFALSTIATMLIAVLVGLRSIPLSRMRIAPGLSGAFTGTLLCACGLTILLGF